MSQPLTASLYQATTLPILLIKFARCVQLEADAPQVTLDQFHALLDNTLCQDQIRANLVQLDSHAIIMAGEKGVPLVLTQRMVSLLAKHAHKTNTAQHRLLPLVLQECIQKKVKDSAGIYLQEKPWLILLALQFHMLIVMLVHSDYQALLVVLIAQQATTAQISTKDRSHANQVPTRLVLVRIPNVTLVLMEFNTLCLDRPVAQGAHQAILVPNLDI
jgi:hypothetical protein